MRRFFALFIGLCLAAVAPPSRAELVMSNNDGSMQLRLLPSKCSHGGTLALIKAEFHAEFRNARIVDKSATIVSYGCWIEAAPDVVFVLFEDGSSTDMKLSAFKDPVI